jgi:hypothetical protein
MSDVSSEKRADAKETLAEVQEATEQRMHSVADLIPQKRKRSTSVRTDCPRVHRSTAAKLSAAAPMTTNLTRWRTRICRKSSRLRVNHRPDLDFSAI